MNILIKINVNSIKTEPFIFSQQLALPLRSQSKTVFEIDSCDDLLDSPINTDNHCYGCAAGKGSS